MAWHGIVTLNESGFCLSTDHESICLPSALPPLGRQSRPTRTACPPSRGVNLLFRGHRSPAFPHEFPLFSIQSSPVSYVQSEAKFFKLFRLHPSLHSFITDHVLMSGMKRSMKSMRTSRNESVASRVMRSPNGGEMKCSRHGIAMRSRKRPNAFGDGGEVGSILRGPAWKEFHARG
jgi:hypothetical protein